MQQFQSTEADVQDLLEHARRTAALASVDPLPDQQSLVPGDHPTLNTQYHQTNSLSPNWAQPFPNWAQPFPPYPWMRWSLQMKKNHKMIKTLQVVVMMIKLRTPTLQILHGYPPNKKQLQMPDPELEEGKMELFILLYCSNISPSNTTQEAQKQPLHQYHYLV